MSQIKKVVVIGPECTGKSELSEFLAREFDTVWVREFARAYLQELQRPYEASDLLHIAEGQLALEDAMTTRANGLVISDTDLYVIKVWSVFKYGFCPPEILQSIATRKYDLYLLTYIDVPWQHDPLREHPHHRQDLYEIYLKEMQQQPVPFVEISGTREERRARAIDAIQTLMKPTDHH